MTGQLPFMAVWSLGPWEIILILLVALLLFGRRLPEVARSLGRSLIEFKKGMRETKDEIEKTIDSDEHDQHGKD